jgi:hypothetical protein
MKPLILTCAIVFIFSINAFTQKSSPLIEGFPIRSNGQFGYEYTFDLPNVPASEIRELVARWFVGKYSNANQVIQHSSDKSTIGKGYSIIVTGPHWSRVTRHLHHKLAVYYKDGKVNCVIDELSLGTSGYASVVPLDMIFQRHIYYKNEKKEIVRNQHIDLLSGMDNMSNRTFQDLEAFLKTESKREW